MFGYIYKTTKIGNMVELELGKINTNKYENTSKLY